MTKVGNKSLAYVEGEWADIYYRVLLLTGECSAGEQVGQAGSGGMVWEQS